MLVFLFWASLQQQRPPPDPHLPRLCKSLQSLCFNCSPAELKRILLNNWFTLVVGSTHKSRPQRSDDPVALCELGWACDSLVSFNLQKVVIALARATAEQLHPLGPSSGRWLFRTAKKRGQAKSCKQILSAKSPPSSWREWLASDADCMIKCDTQCSFLSAGLYFSASGIRNPTQRSAQGHNDPRPCCSESVGWLCWGRGDCFRSLPKKELLCRLMQPFHPYNGCH